MHIVSFEDIVGSMTNHYCFMIQTLYFIKTKETENIIVSIVNIKFTLKYNFIFIYIYIVKVEKYNNKNTSL